MFIGPRMVWTAFMAPVTATLMKLAARTGYILPEVHAARLPPMSHLPKSQCDLAISRNPVHVGFAPR